MQILCKREMECTIDEMGVLALYNRINNIQKLGSRKPHWQSVKDIVDEAVSKVRKRWIQKAFGSYLHLKDIMDARRLAEYCQEKDFEESLKEIYP
ncbi:MAG: hypothetical protein ACLUD0_06935 [Eubacterium ramulus]